MTNPRPLGGHGELTPWHCPTCRLPHPVPSLARTCCSEEDGVLEPPRPSTNGGSDTGHLGD